MSRYVTDEDLQAFSDQAQDEGTVTADDEEVTPEEPDGEEGDVGAEPDGEEASPDASDESDEGEAEEPTIELSVGGQTLSLTKKQIADGFMRQADYTRKTQQLAAERNDLSEAQAIATALDRNPVETLRTIARYYNVPWGNDEFAEEPPGPTPEQLALQDMYAWRQQFEQSQRVAEVDQELARLHREYGDFEDDALFTFAVDTGVAHLETALRAMNYGQPANSPKRTEKRKVQGMAGGQARSTVVQPKEAPTQISKFSDALAAAKRELDYQ